MTAAKLIKLRKSKPPTNNLPQQSQSSWFDHECKLLRQQRQQAENTHPGAQATILLLAQLQHTMSRKSRQHNSHQIMQCRTGLDTIISAVAHFATKFAFAMDPLFEVNECLLVVYEKREVVVDGYGLQLC